MLGTCTSLRLTVAAIAAIAVSGCSRTPAPPAPAGPTPRPAESAGNGDQTADTATTAADATQTEARVIAQVGDRAISADDVTAVVELLVREGKATMSAKAIRAALDEMIADAVVAGEARAEGFDDSAIARRAQDAALAALYLDSKTRAEAEAAVADDDVARYFGPRRRAGKLVVATREAASALQTEILAAVATTPDQYGEIFADFRAKQGLAFSDTDTGAATPFDVTGRGPVGEPVCHERVAEAAFALKDVGAVSPPIALAADRWALVQLLAVTPGTAPEALTAEQKDHARAALVAARAELARAALLQRLQDKAEVRIDDARLAELVASLAQVDRARAPIRRLPLDVLRLKGGRLRQLPGRLPGVTRRVPDIRDGSPEDSEHRPTEPRPPLRRPRSLAPTGDTTP